MPDKLAPLSSSKSCKIILFCRRCRVCVCVIRSMLLYQVLLQEVVIGFNSITEYGRLLRGSRLWAKLWRLAVCFRNKTQRRLPEMSGGGHIQWRGNIWDSSSHILPCYPQKHGQWKRREEVPELGKVHKVFWRVMTSEGAGACKWLTPGSNTFQTWTRSCNPTSVIGSRKHA